MRLLFDTHLLLWSALDDPMLGPAAAALIDDPANELFYSVASFWEVAIKQSAGRRSMGVPVHALRRSLRAAGYEELPILAEHALAVTGTPLIHKDPFDRLLLAQASVEGLLLLTRDATLASYPGPVRLV